MTNSNNQHNNYNSNYQDSTIISNPNSGLNTGYGGFMTSILLNNPAALSTTSLSANMLLPTPSNTPNTQRKNRRISNIFVNIVLFLI